MTEYANEGVREYWAKVRAGEIEHNPKQVMRGKDKTPRATKARLEIGAKLKKAYGFDVTEEIIVHKGAIDKLYEIAHDAEKNGDLETALQAYKDGATQHGKFISTVLPYVETKKGTQTDDEDTITVDDLDAEVQAMLEDNSDGTS